MYVYLIGQPSCHSKKASVGNKSLNAAHRYIFFCDVTTATPRRLRESLGVVSEPRKEYIYYSRIRR